MQEGSYSDEIGDSGSLDLRTTVRRVLQFQRGYLRRRWATYYAVWALAVSTYFIVPYLLGFTGYSTLPSAARDLTFAALDLVITIAAVVVTILLWGLAERTSALRNAADHRPSLVGPRNLLRLAIVVAIVIAASAISTRSNLAAFVLADTSLLFLALLLFWHLHRAFRPIPGEGLLAAAAFVTAAALSYVSLFLFGYTLGHEIAWSAAVVVWFGCAAYARFGGHSDSEGLG